MKTRMKNIIMDIVSTTAGSVLSFLLGTLLFGFNGLPIAIISVLAGLFVLKVSRDNDVAKDNDKFQYPPVFFTGMMALCLGLTLAFGVVWFLIQTYGGALSIFYYKFSSLL